MLLAVGVDVVLIAASYVDVDVSDSVGRMIDCVFRNAYPVVGINVGRPWIGSVRVSAGAEYDSVGRGSVIVTVITNWVVSKDEGSILLSSGADTLGLGGKVVLVGASSSHDEKRGRVDETWLA